MPISNVYLFSFTELLGETNSYKLATCLDGDCVSTFRGVSSYRRHVMVVWSDEGDVFGGQFDQNYT